MIAGDNIDWDGPLFKAIKIITVPVWVPIYLIGKQLWKISETVLNPEPEPVRPPAEARLIWKPVTDLERQVYAAMILAGRPVTNAELARLMNVSPAEASKRVTELQGRLHQGILRRERVGREVRISLPHYH